MVCLLPLFCVENAAYLLQLALHARHQHDAGHAHSQQQEEGVDEPSHCGVVPTGAASTQQAGGTATQARDLHTQWRREIKGPEPWTIASPLVEDPVELGSGILRRSLGISEEDQTDLRPANPFDLP